MEKKISIKTLYLIAIISLGLIGLGIGSTYAMFTASAEISNPISLSSNLNYNSDILETVTLSIEPKTTKTATLNITNNTSNTLNYITWYSATNDRHLKIGITEDSSSVSGTLVAAGSASVIVEVRNAGTTTFTINIGISSSSGSVVLDNSMKTVPNKPLPKILTKYITDLYTNSTKTVVTNNSIEYNYATSVSLMNDRLGGTTSDYNAGNIRYYGASPNNYIYFNCSDYSNQTSDTCELWRIIGIFDGKVKIIRNESIGNYSWDNKDTSTGAESDYGKNDWTTARVMKLLNPSDYYTIDANDNGLGQSLYYTAQSGTCYCGKNNATTSCDFTSTGLKNDATRNMIEEVNWNIGGWNSFLVYSDQIYRYERGTIVYPGGPTSWTGKIALAYPSDYGYAADLDRCTQTLDSYNDSTCTSVNWMKIMAGSSSLLRLLTLYTENRDGVWDIKPNGSAYSYAAIWGSNGAILPVLYLNSEATIESGEGTSSMPYKLSVS